MKNFFKKLFCSDSMSKNFSETVQRIGKNNAGFSLVELIVVIAIMAILAAVAVVGVSVYIPKAQKSGDEQTINDIKQAFELYAYDNPNATDYVILTTSGATAKEGGFADEALTGTFGAGWRNELKLQYKDWASDSSMLSAALNADKVSGSSYLTNSSVNELLGNVQEVTSAAAGLLGSVSKSKTQYLTLLEASMGKAYMEQAVAAGVIDKTDAGEYDLFPGTYTENNDGTITVSDDLQNQLSNLMVFGVAGQLDSSNTTTTEMEHMMLSGLVDGVVIDTNKHSVSTVMAARYALYKAYAADMGGEAEKSFNKMNEAMNKASSKNDAEAALNTFVAENQAGLQAYVESDFDKHVTQNAQAVTQIMGGVNAAAPNYSTAGSLADSTLFTSDAVTGDLDIFTGMAAVELTDAQRAELQSILASNPNAVVVMITNGKIVTSVN